jgi:hypothetical protein
MEISDIFIVIGYGLTFSLIFIISLEIAEIKRRIKKIEKRIGDA